MTSLSIAVTLAGLGCTLVVLLAALRQRTPGSRVLAMFLVSIAAQMTGNTLLATGQVREWPHVAQLHAPLAFAVGPFFYAYVRALAGRSLRSSQLFLHLAPAALVLAWLAPFYLQPAEAKRALLASALVSYPVEWRLRQAVLVVMMGLYVVAAWRLGARALETTPSAASFARPLLRAMPLLWAVAAARFAFAYDASTATYATAMAGATVGLVVSRHMVVDRPHRIPVPAAPPRSAADGPDDDACLRTATVLMEARELFRDRQLTLETLAHAAGTTPHHLSRVINARCGRSVPDWINGYRVEAMKRALAEPAGEAQTIHAIAMACGFSARSTYTAAFRRATGLTPGEVRRQSRSDL